ncbi:hypothetical protein B0T17DRAFT_588185 [Bombardia bombarda]|uniref:Ph domain-containing protein n=1 Tax=Bombardia bombarda TaxID=252184 RepID=A0AA39XPF3_9PEZI|nr:hypothetical protein B0T17DRAFT_588185 [Bombardia bombarda]
MNAVVQILGKKALGNLKKNKTNTNSDNPYLEKAPVYNKRGQISKYKNRERPIPEELSHNDKKILKSVRKRAYRWDMGFSCCCFSFRFGWSVIIGIIPFIGDVIDLMMAYSIVNKAAKVDGGLPNTLRAKMMFNIMVDFAIGFVPVLGDFADALFRANTRNAWLLDAYLTEKAKALREGKVHDSDGGSTVNVPSGLRIDDEPQRSAQQPLPQQSTQPTPARGVFLGSGRTRQPDVEMGVSEARGTVAPKPDLEGRGYLAIA